MAARFFLGHVSWPADITQKMRATILAAKPGRRAARLHAAIEARQISTEDAWDLMQSPDFMSCTISQNTPHSPSRHTNVLIAPEYGFDRRLARDDEEWRAHSRVYAQLAAIGLVPSTTFNHLAAVCARLMACDALDRGATARGALDAISAAAIDAGFVHIALCGHGSGGGLVMRDRSVLTQTAIADRLSNARFKGHALITINACESDVGLSGRDAWRGSRDFKWTVITAASDAIVECNALHFARVATCIAPMVAMGTRSHDIRNALGIAWDAARDPNEEPRHWLPVPTVRAWDDVAADTDDEDLVLQVKRVTADLRTRNVTRRSDRRAMAAFCPPLMASLREPDEAARDC